MPMTGSEIVAALERAKPADWQMMILQYALDGQVPSWVSNVALWPWVTVKGTIDGKAHALSYQVLGNYYAEGTDTDPQFVPFIPAYAQQVADRAGAILPSRKMVSDIERGPANVVRLPYEARRLPNHQPAMWADSNRAIWRKTPAGLGGIVVNGGSKKNVVVGPNLDGSRVAIYGGFNGAPTTDGWVRPPYVISPADAAMPFTQGYNSTSHEGTYFDHSHGVRLVRRQAILDGEWVDLRSVFRDPKLWGLVSDQGPFDPRYPNSTAGIRPTASFDTDDQGYAPLADDHLQVERRFPVVPLAVGAVTLAIFWATLRIRPPRRRP
jgi:hypothetical protein